ncbi:leucyl aminopeptidase [Sulfurihydrogenibium sp.]|uniref:leucyl aminopeptidase n=1 Tax=Sulfurihydrogenibium sp. TaxID=2053621 RepID=UPI003D12AF87
MKFDVVSKKVDSVKADALVFPLFEEDKKFENNLKKVDDLLSGELSRIVKSQKFKASEGKILAVPTFGKLKVNYVFIVGLGSKKKFELDILRRISAYTVKKAKELKTSDLVIDIDTDFEGVDIKEAVQALTEGAILGSYNFDKYFSEKDDFKVESISFNTSKNVNKESLKEYIHLGKVLAEAQNFTRDLVNEPANVINTIQFAKIAEDLAREYGFEIKVYDEEEIEKMGMGAYLAVAKGSENPPRFVHLTYRPEKSEGEIVIVGKGLMFDSGGLNIKTGDFMRWMKTDKAGACAVLGVFKAIGELRPNITVHGIVAAAENMPSGKAYRPDDILRAKNGVTIEVGNTDAEGRLTLADALSYASELKPDAIIDMATLTGACVVALGEFTAGVMGNNQKLINEVLKTSEKTGEWMWQLPFNDKLREQIKAPHADVYNVGTTRYGGAITAGLFLEKFVDPKIPWVHIDIAGPSHHTSGWYYHPKGATGIPVRTITTFLLKRANYLK